MSDSDPDYVLPESPCCARVGPLSRCSDPGSRTGVDHLSVEVGVVGANIEDQLRPLADAARDIEAVMATVAGAGVPDFVLNARTDVFLRAGDRDPREVMADAFGPQRLTLIGFPGIPSLARLEELGVARVSYGPIPQWAALRGLRDMAREVGGGTWSHPDMPMLS